MLNESTTLKIKELFELTIQEAKNIKKYAKPSEIKKLNFNELIPTKTANCIYGQMTGNCYSDRAKKLLKKCAIPYSDNLPIDEDCNIIRSKLQEKNKVQSFGDGLGFSRSFSPIENFIIIANNKDIEKLIDFLQDKTQELVYD